LLFSISIFNFRARSPPLMASHFATHSFVASHFALAPSLLDKRNNNNKRKRKHLR
jgi:hypothetical protein